MRFFFPNFSREIWGVLCRRRLGACLGGGVDRRRALHRSRRRRGSCACSCHLDSALDFVGGSVGAGVRPWRWSDDGGTSLEVVFWRRDKKFCFPKKKLGFFGECSEIESGSWAMENEMSLRISFLEMV